MFVRDLGVLELDPDDQHHLSQVLRLRPGEVVVACDGVGNWLRCRYRGASESSRAIEADGHPRHEPEQATPVHVGFAPTKGGRPEWTVQKLTELGVDRITMVRSARAVVRWEPGRSERVVERMRRIARQAAAQSRRARLPEISGVVSLAEVRASVSPGVLALAEPGAGPPAPDLAALVVGPEGGWERSELEEADRLVGLAPGILRAETAALSAAALLCALRDGYVEVPAADPAASPTPSGRAGQEDACNHHAE